MTPPAIFLPSDGIPSAILYRRSATGRRETQRYFPPAAPSIPARRAGAVAGQLSAHRRTHLNRVPRGSGSTRPNRRGLAPATPSRIFCTAGHDLRLSYSAAWRGPVRRVSPPLHEGRKAPLPLILSVLKGRLHSVTPAKAGIEAREGVRSARGSLGQNIAKTLLGRSADSLYPRNP